MLFNSTTCQEYYPKVSCQSVVEKKAFENSIQEARPAVSVAVEKDVHTREDLSAGSKARTYICVSG